MVRLAALYALDESYYIDGDEALGVELRLRLHGEDGPLRAARAAHSKLDWLKDGRKPRRVNVEAILACQLGKELAERQRPQVVVGLGDGM